MKYADFLKTPYWRDVAYAVKKRDGFRCVVCNTGGAIAAHHRTYAHHGEEHLHLGDLTTLCNDCHERHHFPPPPPRERVVKVVETVVRREVVREVVYMPRPRSTPPPDIEKIKQMQGKKFFSHAAVKLSIKAVRLRELGREAVEAMLDEQAARYEAKKQRWAPPSPEELIVGDPATVDRDMPPGNQIVLTLELIDLCRTNGAFTSATVRAFGLDPGRLVAGWPRSLVGSVLTREQFREAMLGRHRYASRKSANRANGANRDCVSIPVRA